MQFSSFNFFFQVVFEKFIRVRKIFLKITIFSDCRIKIFNIILQKINKFPEVFLSKKDLLLFISLLVSILTIFLFIFKSCFSKPDVVYVDNVQLFEGFNMTKEMKKLGEAQFNLQKSKIDSLYSKIQKSSSSDKEILMKEYIGLKENLQQFNQQFAYEETQKIWKRLYSYIDEFSSQKKYKLIIGSEKKEDVLYSDEELNITKELINFVNSKYEGAK